MHRSTQAVVEPGDRANQPFAPIHICSIRVGKVGTELDRLSCGVGKARNIESPRMILLQVAFEPTPLRVNTLHARDVAPVIIEVAQSVDDHGNVQFKATAISPANARFSGVPISRKRPLVT